jgi:cytochrome c-type biogenesis protein CcmH/NrfG
VMISNSVAFHPKSTSYLTSMHDLEEWRWIEAPKDTTTTSDPDSQSHGPQSRSTKVRESEVEKLIKRRAKERESLAEKEEEKRFKEEPPKKGWVVVARAAVVALAVVVAMAVGSWTSFMKP